MRNWIYAAVLLAGPALAQPTLPTKEPGTEAPKAPAAQPAKKDTAKAKPAAQGTTIAKVNGIAVPRARADLLMRQQGQRHARQRADARPGAR